MDRMGLVVTGSREERRVPPSGKLLGQHPGRHGASWPPWSSPELLEASRDPRRNC